MFCCMSFLSNLFRFTPVGLVGNLIGDLINGRNPVERFVEGADGVLSDVTGDSSASLSGIAGSFINKETGAGLTGAEREANAFNAEEAQKQRDWETEMDNTKYQRAVADARSAGINPMMVAGGSPTAPSGSSASSVSPSSGSSLSEILQAIALPSQIAQRKSERKLIEAEAKESEARAANLRSQTSKTDWETEWSKRTADLREEALRLGNEASRAQGKLFWKKVDEVEAHIHKLIVETDSESERKLLISAQRFLADAQANEIGELLSYRKSLMSATAALQRKQASAVDSQISLNEANARRAAAEEGLAAVQAMYKQGLIDNGYLEAFVREANAKASSEEYKAAVAEVAAAIRTGKPVPHSFGDQNLVDDVASGFLATIAAVLDNFNPIAGLLK